jgi:signal transduction histidine kinase
MIPLGRAAGFRTASTRLRFAVWLALSTRALAIEPTGPAPVLSTAAEVRALSEAEARRALPVRLRGVFVGEADPEGIAFVIHDGTDGIYMQGPAEQVATLERGDLLEAEGVTDPGGFAPYVVAQRLRKIGTGSLPKPIRVTVDELNAGKMDAKWVEFSGVVRRAEPKVPSDLAPPPPGTRYTAPPKPTRAEEPKVKLLLAAGSARVTVQVNQTLNPEDYVDAEVTVRGLCFNLHNHNRQFVRPFVQVPRGVDVAIKRPPSGDGFGGPPRPVASLLQFEQLAERPGHRVHVRGIVVHHEPGVALWVRDEGRSLRAQTTQPGTLQPGDEVDVLGFPAQGDYSAVLEDAVFRKRGVRPPPAPHALEDVAGALQHDADLVQLDARLTELRRFPDHVAFTLQWSDRVLHAQMHLPEKAPTPTGWLPQSVVRVSGICDVIAEDAGPLGGLWEPHSFQLLVRAPSDVAVIQPPPWWNAERVVYVLAGFLVLALAAVAVVMRASRRRLLDQEHRRAMAEAEFTAILSERNRVAREIHDTLSQSLGAISVQLELSRAHAGEIGERARHHLGAAHKLTRAALAEARESIWNMRSQVLEKNDLGAALEGILLQMTEGTDVTPSMRIEGERRRLPPVVENNLLRIGQEAITNAHKHAKATRIEVVLTIDRRTVCLRVEDDGVGFVTGAPPPGERRTFGLVGIRERTELLGGKVEIDSAPGRGTRIVVTVTV